MWWSCRFIEPRVAGDGRLSVLPAQQEVEAAAQRTERIAQLVGEDRQKLVLLPGGLAQRRLRPFELERCAP